jgi:hypothetical protein
MFAGMVLLLTRELKSYSGGELNSEIDQELWRPIAFMFSALFSLVIAAFLFAATSGEDAAKADPWQALSGAMPSLVLSIGVVQMAVALAWLLQARSLKQIRIEMATLIVRMTILVTALFLSGVVVSPWFETPTLPPFGNVWITWLAFSAILMAAWPISRLFRNTIRTRFAGDSVIRFVNVVTIVVAALGAAGWNVLTGVGDPVSFFYSKTLGTAVLLIGSAVVMVIFALLETATPDSEPWLSALAKPSPKQTPSPSPTF